MLFRSSTGVQDQGLAVSLFIDSGNSDFTNSLKGNGQKLGFAGRIAINSSVLADNTKLVQATSTGTTGDVSRVNYLYNQLNGMTFADPPDNTSGVGGALNGTVSGVISQFMDFQGSSVAGAQAYNTSHTYSMAALNTWVNSEFGVNVNDEMARLVELQSAYAANARVVSVVQQLLQSLQQTIN